MTLSLDAHCHLDRYASAHSVAREAANRGIFVVAVTNLPSHFHLGVPHVRQLRNVRLALGFHPLATDTAAEELTHFRRYLDHTSFLGEVGLDFSVQGRASKQVQLARFRLVAECAAEKPKVVSVHSRGAEAEVLATLDETGVRGAIFHWYTGPVGLIDALISSGHYFSVNPAMLESRKGRQVIAAIPPDRLLTESDGPYARVRGRIADPWDVRLVEEYLAVEWARSQDSVRETVWRNFRTLCARLGTTEPVLAGG